MPAPTTCWAPVSTQLCGVVSTSINSVSSCQVTVVTLSSDSSRQMAFGSLLCRSRIRAHNKLSGA